MADEEKKVEQSVAPAPAGADDVEKGKAVAWLGYLFFLLWLIPMLTLKDNQFVKFHVKQAIVCDIIAVAIGILAGALWWTVVIPILLIICAAVVGIIRLIGLIQTLSGKYWKAPLGIGSLAASWFKF